MLSALCSTHTYTAYQTFVGSFLFTSIKAVATSCQHFSLKNLLLRPCFTRVPRWSSQTRTGSFDQRSNPLHQQIIFHLVPGRLIFASSCARMWLRKNGPSLRGMRAQRTRDTFVRPTEIQPFSPGKTLLLGTSPHRHICWVLFWRETLFFYLSSFLLLVQCARAQVRTKALWYGAEFMGCA